MKNLYVLSDTINNGYFPDTLEILSLFSLLCALIVITIKNPISCVLSLICLFFCVSAYLISIGAGFLGFAYLLVYIGAVSILFLFILMLINIRISELVSGTKNSLPLVLIVAFIFVFGESTIFPAQSYYWLSTTGQIKIITHNGWEGLLTIFDHIVSVGSVMYTVYAIWLIIVSIILLLAMVGAIAITVKPELQKLVTRYVLRSSWFRLTLFYAAQTRIARAHYGNIDPFYHPLPGNSLESSRDNSRDN